MFAIIDSSLHDLLVTVVITIGVCIFWHGWPQFITINKITKNYYNKEDER